MYGSRRGLGGFGGLSLQSLFLHARTAAREEKGTSAPPLDAGFRRELKIVFVGRKLRLIRYTQ